MRYKYIIAVMTFCSITVAQVKVVQPGTPNDLDQKFTPGTNSVLNNQNSDGGGSSDNSGSDAEFDNVVKNNLAFWPRNIAAFGYERFFSEYISLEAWVGLAFKKDIVFGTMGSQSDMIFENGPAVSVLSLQSIYKYGKNNGVSPYLGASLKIHYSGIWSYWYDENNSYIEIGVRSYSNKLDVASYALLNPNGSDAVSFSGSTDVKVKHINYVMNYGLRFTTDGKIKTSHELYTGFGLRLMTYDAFSSEQINNGFGYSEVYRKNGEQQKTMTLMYVLGYILGFGF
jgi:hypothetical protein